MSRASIDEGTDVATKYRDRTSKVLIRAVDLWKSYRMGTESIHALRNLSFQVETNEYVAIMGPSGSGKSTLMNVIGCLDTPTRGQYFLHGKRVSAMDDDELAQVRNQEIGFVFQTFNLLARASAYQNVELPLLYSRLPRSQRRSRTREILAQVELSDRANHRPNELSGGQRQRVAIGRALVNRPSILLADEPTGNLDSRTGREILNLFDALHRNGNTIVLVTHDPAIADRAHRVIELLDGKITRDEKLRGRDGTISVRGESPASTETGAAPAGPGALREHTGSM
jgi:putative ABC transport system ATP-binding protein